MSKYQNKAFLFFFKLLYHAATKHKTRNQTKSLEQAVLTY